jgi:hypothetical protein
MMPQRNRLFSLLALLLLSLSLASCATKSSDSMPVQPPQIPSLPPSLAKPPPQESYLERAQSNIEAWLKELTSSETK